MYFLILSSKISCVDRVPSSFSFGGKFYFFQWKFRRVVEKRVLINVSREFPFFFFLDNLGGEKEVEISYCVRVR